MAWAGSALLFALAVASTWLTYEIFFTSLPTSDKVWFVIISSALWAALSWCLNRAIHPRRG